MKNAFLSISAFLWAFFAVSAGYAALSSGLSVSDRASSSTQLSSASWNRIVDAVLELDGRTQYRGASAYLTSNVSASPGQNVVSLTTESFDTDNFHSTTVNPSRMTVPSGLAGKYLVRCATSWAQSSGGTISAFVLKNGATAFKVRQPPSNADSDEVNASRVLHMNVGDYVECSGYTTQSTRTLLWGEANTWMDITYLGP